MAKRIMKTLSADEAARYRAKVAKIDTHKVELLAEARECKRRDDLRIEELRTVFRTLRAERERQGLSLADIQERTGMSRESICRLENQSAGNCQVSTIEHYA